jgi:hypothetical protein
VAVKTTPHLFWLTIEAYPLGHAGAAFGDVVPRRIPERKNQSQPLALRGTIFVM